MKYTLTYQTLTAGGYSSLIFTSDFRFLLLLRVFYLNAISRSHGYYSQYLIE